MLTTSNYPRRCRTNGISSVSISSVPGTLLSRPKLPVRSFYKPKTIFNCTYIENAPFSKSKRFKARKINSNLKMDIGKKKIPDYTETAYREAVSRLKYLLAESYSARTTGKIVRDQQIYRPSNLRIHEFADDTDDRSAMSDCSKGFPGNSSSRANTLIASEKCKPPMTSQLISDNSQLTPKELMSLVIRQEEYIEHLEQESSYCKDELKNLIGKIREVVTENETLNDKNKPGLLKSFLNQFDHSNDIKKIEKTTAFDTEPIFGAGKQMKYQIVEGPMIIYESRISELEAQLTQAKIELQKAQEENQYNILKLSENSGSSTNPNVLIQLDEVMREKREIHVQLEEALHDLQIAREREQELIHKSKRAKDSVQQAEFEKSQVEAEVRRLKDELERQRDKIREATQETCRRLAEERHQVERRYSQQVEQLSADIATHWDAASKSHLEVEKQRREITDLKRELTQKQALIDDLKKELQLKISSLQSDLNQMTAEKDATEQEVATAKLATERYERQVRQEHNRWQAEINSYKQRLERADADIVHCRRENLRLSEQIASLEKELNMIKLIHAPESQELSSKSKGENEKDLTTMIMDMETKHVATVSGLEDDLSNQAKLVTQLSAECQSLTQRLDDNNRMHKEEMATLQSNIEYLSNKIKETLENQKVILSGRSSKIPDVDPMLDSSKIKQDNSSYNINDPTIESYSPTGDQHYAHNFNNQQHSNEKLESSTYELPADNLNPQSYSAQNQNYPTEYTDENYEQYDQYDPSMYHNQPSDQDHQLNDDQVNNQQHYENYSNNEYTPDQQQQQDSSSQGQQYVESNPNENIP